MTAVGVVLASFTFPLSSGDFAGCEATLQFEADEVAVDALVPDAETCEGRCGVLVGPSDLSGERLGILAVAEGDHLARLELPAGLWEAPVNDENDDGEPTVAVVFHSPQRCRALRAAR